MCPTPDSGRFFVLGRAYQLSIIILNLIRRVFPAVFALAALSACAGHRAPVDAAPPAAASSDLGSTLESLANHPDDSPPGERIVAHAEAWSVAGKMPHGSREDCSGFVTAVYAAAGHPLDIPDRYQKGSSVAAMLHAWAKGDRRIFRDGMPKPGDLAFFRDTTGPFHGRVTHVAIVERVHDDGSVELIHYMGGKVRHDPMDVDHPRDPARNGFFRRKTHAGDPVLAGQLFVAYARFDEERPDQQARR